jgi:DNA-directed RNA polymerase subunit E'/Rpb7
VVHVFSPQNGMVLEATVAEISSTHLSLLAYGVFNATISATSINDDSFTFEDSQWCGGTDNQTIVVGTQVKFQVRHVQHSDVSNS